MKLASDLLQACNWPVLPVLPVQSTTALSTNSSSSTLASRFEHWRFLNQQPSGKVQLELAESSSGSREGSTLLQYRLQARLAYWQTRSVPDTPIAHHHVRRMQCAKPTSRLKTPQRVFFPPHLRLPTVGKRGEISTSICPGIIPSMPLHRSGSMFRSVPVTRHDRQYNKSYRF